MLRVATARILAEKALNKTCGQQCVDWAIGLLEKGHDESFLLRLSAMQPPHNHFEIANLRDRALDELNIGNITYEEAVRTYAAEILRPALDNDADLIQAVAVVSHLCIESDYQREIYDFYLLDNAYVELKEFGVQWYWNDATQSNIVSIMRDQATRFVRAQPPFHSDLH